MKLYELPGRSLFRLDANVQAPPGAPGLTVGDLYWLGNVDGMYSFCRDSAGRTLHVMATAEVTPLPGAYHVANGAIWCMTCGMVSHSAGDVREKYCGNCKKFHAP